MMPKAFTTYDKNTGKVYSSGLSYSPELFENNEQTVLIGITHSDGYILNGEHVNLTKQPSTHHIFDYQNKQWKDPRTLQDFKAAQWTQIKQARSQAEYAGFTWNGSTFDSDAISQNRITGAVTLAQSSPEFSIDWVLADNTTRTLNQLEMLQVGSALGQHIATQFSKGVALRNHIEAATTQAEVESVVW